MKKIICSILVMILGMLLAIMIWTVCVACVLYFLSIAFDFKMSLNLVGGIAVSTFLMRFFYKIGKGLKNVTN